MPAHAYAPAATAPPRGCALVIDRQAPAARRLAVMLSEHGYHAVACSTLHEAQVQAALQVPDLMVVDAASAPGPGRDLAQEWGLPASCRVLFITSEAVAQADTPAPAGRAGQSERLPRPVDAQAWHQILSPALEAPGLQAGGNDVCPLVGRSGALREVMRQIRLAADTRLPVFVSGETGTGKELVARCLHLQSQRARRPFVAVNGGAISPQLFESEMFGHERGSFTGALHQHAGLFEQAEGGTLFLDEITEMPASQQVKLLRTIESGSIRRVGGTQDLACDVRIVAASNRILHEALAGGCLREDLYYRLAVLVITLPPLRQRVEDIEPLALHFLRQCGPREGRWPVLTAQALTALRARPWPGNARQLRNAIQRAWVLAEGRDIDAALVTEEAPAPAADDA